MPESFHQGEPVFETPWFRIFELENPDGAEPYYAFEAPDFASVVALNTEGHLLLVRQFRPAVNRWTLELPAGLVEDDESPEETARKELCEETGYEAGALELLGTLHPSTARFSNRMWVFFAPEVIIPGTPKHDREANIDAVFFEENISSLLQHPDFVAASSCAALFLAVARGKLKI